MIISLSIIFSDFRKNSENQFQHISTYTRNENENVEILHAHRNSIKIERRVVAQTV